jgi:DNA-directed RNA polymerase specialized sigma subunit
MAKKKNYVNNKDLFQALVNYRKLCLEAEESGDPKPRVPDYIGRCFLLIATRLATKPNFSGYTYKQDMISDGVENCLQYMHNFDPSKSENPFAYFTQYIWNAFLRRIQKEKKQMYIRFKSSQEMMNELAMMESGDAKVVLNEAPEYIGEFIHDFEEKLKPKKIDEVLDNETGSSDIFEK